MIGICRPSATGFGAYMRSLFQARSLRSCLHRSSGTRQWSADRKKVLNHRYTNSSFGAVSPSSFWLRTNWKLSAFHDQWDFSLALALKPPWQFASSTERLNLYVNTCFFNTYTGLPNSTGRSHSANCHRWKGDLGLWEAWNYLQAIHKGLDSVFVLLQGLRCLNFKAWWLNIVAVVVHKEVHLINTTNFKLVHVAICAVTIDIALLTKTSSWLWVFLWKNGDYTQGTAVQSNLMIFFSSSSS